MTPVSCRHCRRRKRQQGRRGLCWTCAQVPEVRLSYPSAMKLGAGHRNADPTPPATPTDAQPGTAAKVDVLAARAAAGVGLWHPADATEFD